MAQEDTLATVEALWRDVLGARDFHREDNFFSVGGTSLTAIKLVFSAELAFGLEIPLSILAGAPSIASMADAIERERAASGESRDCGVI